MIYDFDMDSGREVIEKLVTPRGEIQLQKRNNQYEIIYNGIFLMASYNGASEEEMINRALNLLEDTQDVSILIGGLGVGYSLKSALKFKNTKRIDIVEIEESIIRWNKTYFKEINEYALSDPRVRVFNCDLSYYLLKCTDLYNLIAIDVDNGPDWIVLDSNRTLYKESTLLTMEKRLLPDGILSLWSATQNNDFKYVLEDIFSSVEFIKSSDGNYIYLASNGSKT
ncbi:MAG TPA: spermine/spermidine synthase [Thermoanaerobacterales bacterium]|nr:spermine/spermidine synthase [Thermoanaerobacterales bacterium]